MAVALLDRPSSESHLRGLPIQPSLQDRVRAAGSHVLEALSQAGEAVGEMAEACLDVAGILSSKVKINPFGLLGQFDDAIVHPLDEDLDHLDYDSN